MYLCNANLVNVSFFSAVQFILNVYLKMNTQLFLYIKYKGNYYMVF